MGVSLRIDFDSDNAAFDDDPVGETVRILRDIAEKIESGRQGDSAIHDINGNNLGDWYFVVDDEDEEDDDESLY